MTLGLVYKITSPTKKIYIGKTINLRNRLQLYRNLHCKQQIKIYRSIKKHGWKSHKFEIIENDISCFELSNREIYWIKFYNSNSQNGLNLTNGGEGTMGHRHSEESKRKMSISKKLIIKKYRSVYQFTLDGIFIKKYKSATDAGRCLNKNVSAIQKILNKVGFTAHGFYWSYKKEPKLILKGFQKNLKMCKKTYQYSLSNELIGVFSSTQDAVRKTGLKGVQRAAKSNKTAGGFYWRYC